MGNERQKQAQVAPLPEPSGAGNLFEFRTGGRVLQRSRTVLTYTVPTPQQHGDSTS